MHNGKLNEGNLSIRVCLYENLTPRSLIPLPPDLDDLLKKLKRILLQCFVWPNALKATFSSLSIAFCAWKMRGSYNSVPKRFSGNQLPLSMGKQ